MPSLNNFFRSVGLRGPDDPIGRLFFEVAASESSNLNDVHLERSLNSLQDQLELRDAALTSSLPILGMLAIFQVLAIYFIFTFTADFRLSTRTAVTAPFVLTLIPASFFSLKLLRERRKNEFQKEAVGKFRELLTER